MNDDKKTKDAFEAAEGLAMSGLPTEYWEESKERPDFVNLFTARSDTLSLVTKTRIEQFLLPLNQILAELVTLPQDRISIARIAESRKIIEVAARIIEKTEERNCYQDMEQRTAEVMAHVSRAFDKIREKLLSAHTLEEFLHCREEILEMINAFSSTD